MTQPVAVEPCLTVEPWLTADPCLMAEEGSSAKRRSAANLCLWTQRRLPEAQRMSCQ